MLANAQILDDRLVLQILECKRNSHPVGGRTQSIAIQDHCDLTIILSEPWSNRRILQSIMLKLSVVGLIVSGALLAGSANAHARLQSSQPADKAQLTQAPNSLTLNFNEAAQLAVLKLILDSKEIVIPVDK